MEKIKTYKIVKSANTDDLSTIVNDYIYNGWQPLGGILLSSEK